MIAVGSDHAGFAYKEQTKQLLVAMQIQFIDCGTFDAQSTDYPDWALATANAVADGGCKLGILICGSGIGVSIAANKVPGIRAAACESVLAAQLSRQHNDANILCFGERLVSWQTAEEMIRTFLTTGFDGGERHSRRVGKIHSLTHC